MLMLIGSHQQVKHMKGVTHISFIFDNPNLFGLHLEQIKSIFKSYNEKYRFEGKARNEIIESLLLDNWIRLRYNVKENTWHINFSGDKKNTISRLRKWFNDYSILNGLPSFTFIPVNGETSIIFHNQIEKFLFDEVSQNNNYDKLKTCLNCKHSHWAVGIGQGFFCTNLYKVNQGGDRIKSTGKLVRFMIPSRDYVCEFHEFK